MSDRAKVTEDITEWDLGGLPFYYAPMKRPGNAGLPDTLPFTIQVDPKTGLLRQKFNEKIENTLREAYLLGSEVGGMTGEDEIGKGYADDFLGFVKKSLGRESLDGLRALEIGCGSGYLLHRMKKLGAATAGLEPGEYAQAGADKYQVRIERDFFPSDKIGGKFDIIIAISVLEHIRDITTFLNSAVERLKRNGVILISVPDCAPYIENGDISMFLHEHWNYFTQTTVRTVVANALKENKTEVELSGFGGAVYAAIRPGRGGAGTAKPIDFTKLFKNFITVAQSNLQLLGDRLGDGKTTGIYAPNRIINALHIIRSKIKIENIRFVDDNLGLRGRYFPGFDIPIENREDLLNNPTERTIIFSRSFGDKIAGELRKEGLRSEIMTWNEIFQE